MRYARATVGTPPAAAGSALILALMVMLILTFMGLTLLALTETEMQIGGYQRVNMGVHYAAESGSAVANARVLDGAVAPATFVMEDSPDLPGIFRIGYRVGVSRSTVIRYGPCDFCPANEDDAPWSFRVTYLVNSRASRRDWRSVNPDNPVPADQATVQAQKIIATTFEIQPSEEPRTDGVASEAEAAELKI